MLKTWMALTHEMDESVVFCHMDSAEYVMYILWGTAN